MTQPGLLRVCHPLPQILQGKFPARPIRWRPAQWEGKTLQQLRAGLIQTTARLQLSAIAAQRLLGIEVAAIEGVGRRREHQPRTLISR